MIPCFNNIYADITGDLTYFSYQYQNTAYSIIDNHMNWNYDIEDTKS